MQSLGESDEVSRGLGEALLCDPGAPDDQVLEAVVDYYAKTLGESPEADKWLGLNHLGAPGLVDQLRIGYSNRSLGYLLPERNRKAGAQLRGTLIRLGIYRPNGREHFRGCVVVPIVSRDGSIVGMWGTATSKVASHLWAEGLPGGIFNEVALGDPEIVVTVTIGDALAVLGVGHESVVAPGRPGGFRRADIKAIAASGTRSVVLVGDGLGELGDRLSREGVACRHIAPGGSLASLLGTASNRRAAFEALLDTEACPVTPVIPTVSPASDVAEGEPNDAIVVNRSEGKTNERLSTTAAPSIPGASDAPPARAVAEITGDVSELHVAFGARRWRIRGAESVRDSSCLRVVMSVTDIASGRFHIDTIDLYQAKGRGGFVAGATSELNADAAEVRRELAEVLFATEAAIAAATEEVPLPEMSGDERDRALELLADPKLMDRVISDLGSLGVIGEQTNLAVAYLATISRKCERPFGVIVQSSSAAGKSTLADAALSLVPPEDLVSYSAMTDQSLYYVENAALAHKVLAISEEAGAARASYALKLLTTDGRLSIASTGKDRQTGRLRTTSYEVAGPVALVMTTTATEIDPELSNRLITLGVNEATEQTRAIHSAQRKSATLDGLVARLARSEIMTLHRNAQRLMESLPVVIPGAESLVFPDTAARHRRDHMKLLSLICASALAHQHQRTHGRVEVAGNVVTYVEASEDDIALALNLAESVVVGGVDDLAPQTARLLDVVVSQALSRCGDEGGEPTGVVFTRRELRELLGWSERQVRAATDRLVALDYLVEARQRARATCGFTYALAEAPEDIARRRSPLARRGPRRTAQIPQPAPLAPLAGNPACGENEYVNGQSMGAPIGVGAGVGSAVAR